MATKFQGQWDELAPLVVDDLRNFISGFEVCCTSAHFPIALTMFICSVYDGNYICVQSALYQNVHHIVVHNDDLLYTVVLYVRVQSILVDRLHVLNLLKLVNRT